MDVDDPDLVERYTEFYGAVREYLVLFLLFTILFTISHQLVLYYRRKRDKEDSFSLEEDGAYRFSLYLCSFTLAVSLAAIFLLPFSIFTLQVSVRFPDNYYTQWLNVSLLKLVWNMVFFCSNFCLLCMMPFVYFFTEAEGFSGWRSGIQSRVLETLVMVGIVLVLLACSVWIGSKWFPLPGQQASFYTNIFPMIYSLVSLLGVLLTLLSLPAGIEYIILWCGNQLVLPKANDQLDVLRMEENDLRRRLEQYSTKSSAPSSAFSINVTQSKRPHSLDGVSNNSILQLRQQYASTATGVDGSPARPALASHGVDSGYAATFSSKEDLRRKLSHVQSEQHNAKSVLGSKSFYSTLFFSLSTLFILFLTGIALLSAGQSFLQLVFQSDPDSLTMGAIEVFVARFKTSQTIIGLLAAVLEITLVIFFAFSSLIGVYTSKRFADLRPIHADTSMLLIIVNCNLVLLLSSALPVLIRSLGISRFDLVGLFANLQWLGSWYLRLVYHVIFFVTIGYLSSRRVVRSVLAKNVRFLHFLTRMDYSTYSEQQQQQSPSSLSSQLASPVRSALSSGSSETWPRSRIHYSSPPPPYNPIDNGA